MPGKGVRAKHVIRQLPGVAAARRRVPPLLRRNKTLRHIARRLYAIDATAPVPSDVAAGRLLDGMGTERLPVVLVVILGAGRDTIEDVTDEVARLQVATAGFRPVFVTDVPAFAAFRRYGYPAELLLPADGWEGTETWHEYARRLVGLMLDAYRASSAVTVGPEGLDEAARIVLGSLSAGSRSPSRDLAGWDPGTGK